MKNLICRLLHKQYWKMCDSGHTPYYYSGSFKCKKCGSFHHLSRSKFPIKNLKPNSFESKLYHYATHNLLGDKPDFMTIAIPEKGQWMKVSEWPPLLGQMNEPIIWRTNTPMFGEEITISFEPIRIDYTNQNLTLPFHGWKPDLFVSFKHAEWFCEDKIIDRRNTTPFGIAGGLK